MTKEVELGGGKHPIRFGMAALYMYEEITGRAAISDFSNIQAGDVKLSTIVDLVYCGLVCGYQKQGKVTTFDKYDVADWLGEADGAIEEILVQFAESFPKSKNLNPPKKVKAEA